MAQYIQCSVSIVMQMILYKFHSNIDKVHRSPRSCQIPNPVAQKLGMTISEVV